MKEGILNAPTGRREDPAQVSLFPLRCPCGEYPLETEEWIWNWCRCPELVLVGSVEEWNDWTALRPKEEG